MRMCKRDKFNLFSGIMMTTGFCIMFFSVMCVEAHGITVGNMVLAVGGTIITGIPFALWKLSQKMLDKQDN